MSAPSTSIFQDRNRKNNKSHVKIARLLNLAGITINGEKPWDIQVHNPKLFARVLSQGALGLGESYMDGWWSCDEIDTLVQRIYDANLPSHVKTWVDRTELLFAILLNAQSGSRAYTIGKRHYDIDNDLYAAMLDQRMIYSCGYWKQAQTLDEAQEAKLDLVCRKLFLDPGMRVLDIGCGWGGAAEFMAKRYRVEVVGITVSSRQAELAKQRCKDLPVTIELKDYKQISGRYDRIFSLGMFEHVGFKNYPTYMRFVHEHLEKDGLFLLHTIGANYTDRISNAWVEKYIFPNSMLPSISQIGAASENALILEDWQNFGPDYYRTLRAWFKNFDSAWPELKNRYDERFYRMWKYYLLSFAGAFLARETQLWQIVFSRRERKTRYDAPR